jgi:hypothetical protein
MFWSVSDRFVTARKSMQTGRTGALTHKFTKQGRVRIFRNERIQSTPLDPKLMFWGVSDHFDTARNLMQNWPNWCHYHTSSLSKVASEFFSTNAPIHSIGPKTQVLGCFGPFHYCTKVDAKLAELVPLSHKFSKQSRVGIFRIECTRSTPFDPKLMFWGISDRFVTVRKSMQNWLNRCHLRTSSLNKVASEFFATNAPDPFHWTQSSYFGEFRTISIQHES